MRRLLHLMLFLAILTGFAAADTSPAQAGEGPCVLEVEIPNNPPPGVTIRRDVALAPDGRVWFTQLEANQIGVYDPNSDQFEVFDVPTPNTGPHSLTVDSQGVVWFSETLTHQIGRFDPATQTFAEYPTPTPNSWPYGITTDSLNNVWFTEMDGVAVGKLDPASGAITEYPFDPALDGVENIAIDPATGAIWVTDLLHSKLIRLNPATGEITRFKIPFILSLPHSVAIGPDGRVWYSDVFRGTIGSLNPATGQFRKYTLPTFLPGAHGIIVDSRGLVWFSELTGNKVAVLIPQLFNIILELDVPTPSAGPYFLEEAPNGEIWFIEAEAPHVGRLPCTAGTATQEILEVIQADPA